MTRKPDKDRDRLSGFGFSEEAPALIPTEIPTECRDSLGCHRIRPARRKLPSSRSNPAIHLAKMAGSARSRHDPRLGARLGELWLGAWASRLLRLEDVFGPE